MLGSRHEIRQPALVRSPQLDQGYGGVARKRRPELGGGLGSHDRRRFIGRSTRRRFTKQDELCG